MNPDNWFPHYRFETWQEYEARRSRHLSYCLIMTALCGLIALGVLP